MIHLTLKS